MMPLTHRVVRYISDIHIMHLLQNSDVKTKNDLEYVLTKLAKNIVGGTDPVLIGGDVCSDFEIFKLFIKTLGKYKDKNQYVIFELGNHELWPFPKRSIKKIVDIYRELLVQNGMYLLHNEVLFIDNNGYPLGKLNRIRQ